MKADAEDITFWSCIAIGALAIAVAAWVWLHNFNECRATPHSILYCLTRGD